MTSVQSESFTLGVCYYPEHWPESMWEEDFRRMRKCGFTVVRMAEFAWTVMEPEEGRYDFSLFDRALDHAHQHGLQVILGTPTATPPAWLTSAHPEVLNATIDGLPIHHGMRGHTNHSSPVFRRYCAAITEAMASHFANHPAVIGWQIDNEFNCEVDVFYAEADHAAFREWLQARYGSLEALNEAWGAVFWSQTYTDWAQVHLSRRTAAGSPNPHQLLDEKRFISDNTIAFAKVQTDIIRRIAPHHWITTNGLFGNLDSHRLTDELLDFFSYDSYPLFQLLDVPGPDERDALLDRATGLSLSTVRGISENFCVMEQQSGPGGWTNRLELPTPQPGQMRLWTYQSIAHGADMLLYFRWRTAVFGTEIYWHGINDYHNRPNRRVAEAETIGAELQQVGKMLVGRTYKAEVALLDDYDNEWDGKFDTAYGVLRGPSRKAWYKALQHRHIPVNLVKLRPHTTVDDLTRYRAVVYPHPAILTERTAELLKEYAAQGGVIVFGARTGYKDERGHCRMMPYPGYAAELCGITVEDYTRIIGVVKPAIVRLTGGEAGAAESFEAPLFNDILNVEADSASVEAVYESGYYAGKPALTRNRYGAGEAWYYGAAFTAPIVEALIDRIGLASPCADWLQLPRQVELAVREDGEGKALYFLLNYGDTAAAIDVGRDAVDLLTGEKLAGASSIPPFGVRILEL